MKTRIIKSLARDIRVRAIATIGIAFTALIAIVSHVAAAESLKKLTVLITPASTLDSLWMADSQGYFREVGLDVEFKVLPSGSQALQIFNAGSGDIVFAGELPMVAYWKNSNRQVRIFGILNRNSAEMIAVASKEIHKPSDLNGKTIATLVGSSGSWFVSEYLKKNGLSAKEVKVVNLSPQVLPAAICKGDIDAFFIWYPFNQRALEMCPEKIRMLLNSAEGYMQGYGALGAKPDWLEVPANGKTAELFLGAVRKGHAYAATHFKDVAAYAMKRFGITEDIVKFAWSAQNRSMALDPVFYHDFCQLSAWMHSAGLLAAPIRFNELLYTDALLAVDPKLVSAGPDTCS